VPGSRCEPHPPRRRCFGLLRSARILWGHRPRIPRDPPPTWRQADRELPGPCRDLAASGPHASVSSPLSAPARSCAATATPGRAPPSTGARAMPRPASCAAKSAGPVGLLRRDLVLRRAPPSPPARPGRRLLRLTRPVPYGASLGPLGHFVPEGRVGLSTVAWPWETWPAPRISDPPWSGVAMSMPTTPGSLSPRAPMHLRRGTVQLRSTRANDCGHSASGAPKTVGSSLARRNDHQSKPRRQQPELL
jgi:hypothetical protein